MKIGAMNNPANDVLNEIEFIGESGFDFLDLTLEESASPDNVDVPKVKKLIKRHKLDVIGHTPWNLPISSPFESVRDAAYVEFSRCLDIFKKLGVKLVNVHPFMPHDIADPDTILMQNIDFFKKLVKLAKKHKMTIMMENTKLLFNELEVLGTILDKVPGLRLHWDVGHANLGNEGEKKTKMALHNFKTKIAHMHFSDNNGAEDLHLPLGAGNINWLYIMQTLKSYKYNKTITLEIHSQDISYLLISRDKLRYILSNLKVK